MENDSDGTGFSSSILGSRVLVRTTLHTARAHGFVTTTSA
ncbi:hypothetical protein NY08_1666 [Rhodococcus sp. B7740]|nr:hypothetical protein NY08_1666 [Rhodococcus sp. B7740]